MPAHASLGLDACFLPCRLGLRRPLQGAIATPDAPPQPPTPTPSSFLYDLFAVVCHRGDFKGGHYVSYVRAADGRWYHCDDALITAADEEAVRNCQAYLLFYVHRVSSASC
jgi:hypothetical protein